MSVAHKTEDLIDIFYQSLGKQYNTRVIKGSDEPIYLPANQSTPYHQIVFAHGFYTSALHEIAHWCLAGEKRRQLEDYGYWYCPDGRDQTQQTEFEQVEIKPQAIEWCLSVAAGLSFNVSCDNLNGSYTPNRHAFRAKIFNQVKLYLAQGLPPRVHQLCQALAEFYQVEFPLKISQFNEFER
ncbi:elongation factor P hydroxylase [Catenovulum sp. 2E275]|uniref:elongation factor P hydroxylase n=1 Tax=Catenovulum sp. 2E275 TaxID=2980497 RepID=UPI0021D0CEBD|nr:elongation factor P hydroxylase [Catenovulum sp. 2E275]MCU4675772.1 elongation factor P hydroxylase [Catenovulum sp. 2E275]